jgi:hypothetical protein
MTELYVEPATLRAGDLTQVLDLLKDQRARTVDLPVPAANLSSNFGQLIVAGAEPVIDETGVTPVDGAYRFTQVAEGQLAKRLSIPPAYLRTMRAEALELYDGNVNGWLHGYQHSRHGSDDYAERAADSRRFLVRLLRGEVPGSDGLVRAILSDSYLIIDNLDVLFAVLGGIKGAGVDAQVVSADLTDRRMVLRIASTDVAALAPGLLKDYRSPFVEGGPQRIGGGGWTMAGAREAARREGAGYPQGAEPVVFAGFTVQNSEIGQGMYSIKPSIVVQVCSNGLTLDAAAFAKRHLGAKLDEDAITWSDETQRRNVELITSMTTDAVHAFMSREFLTEQVSRLEREAGVPISNPAETIKTVSRQLAFTEAQQADILDHFIRGGQMTAGGVMQAVSSVAQTVADGEAAADLEAAAIPAMAAAARVG